MSMNPRCFDCDGLLPRGCHCDANPNAIYRPSFVERYERERWAFDNDPKTGRARVAA